MTPSTTIANFESAADNTATVRRHKISAFLSPYSQSSLLVANVGKIKELGLVFHTQDSEICQVVFSAS